MHAYDAKHSDLNFTNTIWELFCQLNASHQINLCIQTYVHGKSHQPSKIVQNKEKSLARNVPDLWYSHKLTTTDKSGRRISLEMLSWHAGCSVDMLKLLARSDTCVCGQARLILHVHNIMTHLCANAYQIRLRNSCKTFNDAINMYQLLLNG